MKYSWYNKTIKVNFSSSNMTRQVESVEENQLIISLLTYPNEEASVK